MRAIRPRRRVAPSGWRALRREAHAVRNRSDALSVTIFLGVALIIGACIGLVALAASVSGHLPPALQVVDDIRFNGDYRRGSTFTSAALAQNARLFLGTDGNGLFAYRTDSGWQGLWQQYTKASTGGGLIADSIQDVAADPQHLWVAASSGLLTADLSGANWQTLVGINGFAPFGKGVLPSRARLSPDGRWIAVATADQGVGLYDSQAHDWQSLNQATGLLPDDKISALEFDPLGNLWIGTGRGLVMLLVGPHALRGPDSLELPNKTVTDVSFGRFQIAVLTADQQVQTLSASAPEGAWVANGQWRVLVSGSPFNAEASLPGDVAGAALTDKALWVITRQGAIGRYDLETHGWQSSPPVSTALKTIRDFAVSGEDAYVAADVGLFHWSDRGTETLLTVPVRKLAVDGTRVWFLGDEAQVGYVERALTTVRVGGRFGPQSGPALVSAVTAYPDSPNDLWVAVPGVGVGLYDLTTHGWQAASDGLPKGVAPSRFLALKGAPAALVTDAGRTGLYTFKNNRWQPISGKSDDVTGVAQASDGLWYQVASGGVYFTDGDPPKSGYFEGAGPAAKSQAAATTTDVIWTVQDDGKSLWRYDMGLHKWERFAQDTPITQLAGSGDTLLALGNQGQLSVIAPNGLIRRVVFSGAAPLESGKPAPSSFTSSAVYGDQVWLATASGQVYRYEPAAHRLSDLTPSGGHVDALHATSDGLWALGASGLYRFNVDTSGWQAIPGLSGVPRRVLPLGSALAVLTDKNTLDWVGEGGDVTQQRLEGFQGWQDLTAVLDTGQDHVWFGSATHGLGIYNRALHTWAVDNTVGNVRTMVDAADGVLIATDQGVSAYGTGQPAELTGDVRNLLNFKGRIWALVFEDGNYVLYRRDAPGKWTPVRKPNAAPIDLNTITAVARAGNRFVFGTSDGKVVDYNLATGAWRTIKDSLPISSVDWIGLSGDLSGDAPTAPIWLVGPQNGTGRLVQIDVRSAVAVRSSPAHNVTSAGVLADRVWYAEAKGSVYYVLTVGAAPVPLNNVLAPVVAPTATPTAVPSATFTPAPTSTRGTGTPGTGRPAALPTATRTPTATAHFTPTPTIPQSLGTEPVRLLATNGNALWLVTGQAAYLFEWDGQTLQARLRTPLNKSVKRLRADDAGLLLAFDDNSAARVAADHGRLDAVQGFDSTVLYADAQWLWRQSNNAISVTLAGINVLLPDGKLGLSDFQAMAASASEFWLGGSGGALQLDENGLPLIYTPPATGLPGTVQGFRYNGQSWYASLGTEVRRFDPDANAWVAASPSDYTFAIELASIGPAQVHQTDKGITLDTPVTDKSGRFSFDLASALATDGKQLFIQTPAGVWATSTALDWGTLSEGEGTDSAQYFSGVDQSTLDTGKADPWQWTLTQDRATGRATTRIALRDAPAVERQIDPATGAFADDVALSLADDPADPGVAWLGTRGGLWKLALGNSAFQPQALVAPGSAVDGLRAVPSGLLAQVGGKPFLISGSSVQPAPADAANATRILVKLNLLGSLLEQNADGFVLPGFVDAPRPGYWFDQVNALAAYQNKLWVATPRGIIAYTAAMPLTATRFDTLETLGLPGVTRLEVAPLDPNQTNPPGALWALDSTGRTTLAFQGEKWQPVPFANSPFASKEGHVLPLPGSVQWKIEPDSVHAVLDGRDVAWSNGRFDFDDVRDIATPPGQLVVATAGGPYPIGSSPCGPRIPATGLANRDLPRIGLGAKGELVVRDDKQQAFALDCGQSKSGAWQPADSALTDRAFGIRQAALDNGQWLIRLLPENAKGALPLAAAGLTDAQLFSEKRFSFDVVRDTAASGDSIWLATAGGPVRISADGQRFLALQGLKDVDSRAIRADTTNANPVLPVLHLAAKNGTFRLQGNQWIADSAPVTDARLVTFDQGQWSSAPLAGNLSPLSVKDAPKAYTLFAPSGKFSFDDVRGVAVQGSALWLATAGGVVQGSLSNGGFRPARVVMDGLCGVPDGIQIDSGKAFVGYRGRTVGQTLRTPCDSTQPWQRPRQIVLPGDSTPLVLDWTDSALVGRRESNEVFRLTQTGQTLWILGSWMPFDKVRLVAWIDDGDRMWLLFDNNLVVLNKGLLRK